MKLRDLIVPAAIVAASLVAPLTVRAGSAPQRDPFRPFFLSAPVAIAVGPLASFSPDDLHVEGIVSGVSNPQALIRTPTGESVEARVGDSFGNRGGHIAEITHDAIVVVETIDGAAHEVILGIAP